MISVCKGCAAAIAVLLMSVTLQAADSLIVSARVSASYPQYGSWYQLSGRSMYASMWITDAAGKFVRTCGRWGGWESATRPKWSKVKTGTVDGYSGATLKLPTGRQDTLLTARWSLKNTSNAIVPNGMYRFYIEYSNQSYQGPWMCGKITIDGTSKTVTEIDSSGTGKAGVLAGTYITGFKAIYKGTPVSTLSREYPASKRLDGFITPAGFSGNAEISGISLDGRTLWKEAISTTPGSIITSRLLRNRHSFAGICLFRVRYGNITRTELAGM